MKAIISMLVIIGAISCSHVEVSKEVPAVNSSIPSASPSPSPSHSPKMKKEKKKKEEIKK